MSLSYDPITANNHLHSLHIIGSEQMGGAERFHVRLVKALNAVGHQATSVNRASSPIAKILSNTAFEQIHLPMANQWDVFSIWRIRRLVQQRQPDIVQTYMGRATRLTRLSRTGHAVHVARLGGYYKIAGYYKHAHAWVGNTRGVCDYLIGAGLPADRVFLIGNFVPEPSPVDEAQLTALRQQLQLPGDALVVFTLGRLVDFKGFDDLLQGFAQLAPNVHNRPVHLLIAGDGPLRDELQALSRQLAIQERVHWIGWQNEPGSFYRLADCVVCPSRHETLGNVILEAWSYTKPILSTATPGGLELLRDGDNGLLAPCKDPSRLAQRLRELITAPLAEQQRLAAAGYRDLCQHHSRAAVVNAYLDLYTLLRERRRSH
ncbi:MAG: glycosyltransferase [Candidatus Competibacteraceae bacterium]